MTRRRVILLGWSVAVALLIGVSVTAAAPATPLQVAFINVGQGDATLIRDGEFAILVDGGRAGAGPTH